MTAPLGASAFASLGAVPVSAPLGASAFASLGAVPITPPAQQSDSVLNNPIGQAAVGAGDALRNTVSSIINNIRSAPSKAQMQNASNMIGGFALPKVNTPTPLPMVNNSTGDSPISYSLGNMAGNIAAYMGGGEALEGARAAAETVPGIVGELSKAIGESPVAARAIGNSAYSGLTAQNNNADQALKGADYSMAADAIPGLTGKLAQGAQYFMPQRYAQNIIQGLSGGQSLQDATKSVLADVKNSYEAQQKNAGDLYGTVRDSIPSGSIYAPLSNRDTTVYGTPIKNGAYQNLPSNITDNYTNDLKDMHNAFVANPTFKNAHALQSELGSVSRQLQSGITPPTLSTLNSASALNNARGALKSDMDDFLQKQSPEIAQQYKDASDYFQQNVVPYRTNPKIYSIAIGDTTNVKPNSLANIFAAPDSDMEKVLGDLPTGTTDKILYTKLGQTVPNKSAQGLLNSFQNLQQLGLSDHISPKLASQLGELENRIKARNGLQMLSSAGAAASLGSLHGGATAGAMMGLGAGAIASPFMNYIGRRLPIDNFTQAISNFTKGAYPAGRSAVLANLLNNSGVPSNGS